MSPCWVVASLLLVVVEVYKNVVVEAFYIPGVNPHSFAEGETVKLKVNKMTSTKTQFPLNYYHFPFCTPVEGPVMDHENLGEFLTGERIQSSPYLLLMKKDMYCEQLCKSHLGKPQSSSLPPLEEISGGGNRVHKGIFRHRTQGKRGPADNKVIRAIVEDYHNNWIVDNLSSASKVEDEEQIMTKYSQGFPIGFLGEELDPRTNTKMVKAYINNHVNIEIMYHQVEEESNKYRIVRFTVEPFSIAHQAEFVAMDDDNDDELNGKSSAVTTLTADYNDSYLPQIAKLNNPILSCDPKISNKQPDKHHTSYDMIHAASRPQEASGQVLFTYDVIWKENKELHWASRWDIYLSGIAPAKVHWETIVFSLVVVVVLSAMIVAILVRNLRRDLARYSKVATSDEEKAEELEEFGWKLVHADVFRPPTSMDPMLLSCCCGTGAQILCMTTLTIVISALGLLNPSQRGALVMAELFLFVLMGTVNGYVTARYYKTLKGKEWQKATVLTALGYPGLCFTFFFILNFVAWSQDSTDKVPFTTMLILLIMWFGVSSPLVFVGAYYGYKQEGMEFPVATSSIPRPIPDQPWFMSLPVSVMISGILPFGSCFVELYYILSSVWMEYYYYMFGFLFLVFLILLLTCAEITVLYTYFQLCSEDYHWWYRSFINGGFTAVYVFLYSIVYFSKLESNTFTTYILYFGYMGLVSIGMFLMLGFVSTTSCLFFNKTIFGSIKID